jgi:predicted Zn-dependent protease
VVAALSARQVPGDAQARHLGALLDEARPLNPDSEVDLLRAELATERGERVLARAILAPVLRHEPMNIDAWVALARASQDDPRTFELALRRARQLAPAVPPPP